MANYQELLSKAVNALPENNGASRREVYEKARKALVTQLRAISPPLPAREITQHRLELEDCIRQVEHEVTETLLGGFQDLDEESIAIEPEPGPKPEPPGEPAAELEPEPEPAAPETKADASPSPLKPAGIDAIIARAEKARQDSPASAPLSPVPSVGAPADDEEVNRDKTDAEASRDDPFSAPVSPLERQLEESMGSDAKTTQPPSAATHDTATGSDTGLAEAMSRVREVELGGPPPLAGLGDDAGSAAAPGPDQFQRPDPRNAPGSPPADPGESPDPVPPPGGTGDQQKEVAQQVVDRAIEVLDREARGEHVPIDEIGLGDDMSAGGNAVLGPGEAGFGSGGEEEKGSSALTIFLVLAIVLLGAVGGGGYWAWREGYVDLDALFATSNPVVPAEPAVVETVADSPEAQPVQGDGTGPGNTATDTNVDAPSEELVSTQEQDKSEDRLAGSEPNVADATTTEQNKTEDRLTTAPETSPPADVQNEEQSNPEVVPAGTQSLLLEASADGTTGAVPFSGTVEWSRGLDEMGQPTLIGTANIPARNLGVRVLIRRNADPTLPASHLMEIDFSVPETFVGGAVAGLPGILLKNEELVQGTALIGASARVVGNSFLFALSAAEQDVRTNINLLKTQKWMDLAIIYASGRRAIITLEKDEAAQAMFDEVLAAWQAEDEAGQQSQT